MDPATIKLILMLLPAAERLIFRIGGQILQLDTSTLTKEDVLKALEESKSTNPDAWPDLKFISNKPEVTKPQG